MPPIVGERSPPHEQPDREPAHREGERPSRAPPRSAAPSAPAYRRSPPHARICVTPSTSTARQGPWMKIGGRTASAFRVQSARCISTESSQRPSLKPTSVQRADVAEAEARMQADRRRMRAIADDSDHLPPRALLAASISAASGARPTPPRERPCST